MLSQQINRSNKHKILSFLNKLINIKYINELLSKTEIHYSYTVIQMVTNASLVI